LDSNQHNYYYNISRIYYELKDYENALLNVKKCLELKPYFDDAKKLLLKLQQLFVDELSEKADTAYSQGNYMLSLELWNETIKAEQENANDKERLANYLNQKGRCYEQLGRYLLFKL
jgi:tetratricopeptide (TPR) repeat protein